MKKYRIPALLLSLVLMLNLLALPAAALEEPELQCTNAILDVYKRQGLGCRPRSLHRCPPESGSGPAVPDRRWRFCSKS